MLMLSSKGAAAVTGGGFITLAATLEAVGTVPVAGLTLLLGVDRFMSEMRALTNLVGNGVATIVVAKWKRSSTKAKWPIVGRRTSRPRPPHGRRRFYRTCPIRRSQYRLNPCK
ncbi:MAG: cation:dicarboxylase symporter family transporter [Ignavibacteriota bacterium]